MITVVSYSSLVHLASVHGPFDTRQEAAKWLHKKALEEVASLNEYYKGKWTVPADQQEHDYAEIHEDGDPTISFWIVEVEEV